MRQQTFLSNSLPALALRLVLALVFIWAGLTKVLGTATFTPAQTARLAVLDLSFTPLDPATATTPPPVDVPEPARPADPEDDPQDDPQDNPQDDSQDETDAHSAPEADPEGGDPVLLRDPIDDEPPVVDPVPTPDSEDDAEDVGEGDTTDEPTGELSAGDVSAGEPGGVIVAVAQTNGEPSAADYPHGSSGKPLNNIALMIDAGANPPLDENSAAGPRTVPAALGRAPWAGLLAWFAAITEILAGLALLLGLLTRLGALTVLGTMLTAMWLSECTPAIQAGNTLLGFLPDYGFGSIYPWRTLLFQLALAAMSFALLCMGGGALSFDRAIFRRPSLPARRDEYDDTL